MSSTPVPPAALAAGTPTSRSTFRLLVKAIGATNREADDLRHRLLASADSDDLSDRLRSLDADDPAGERGVESRLVVWFADLVPADDRMVSATDPVLVGMDPELASRLCAIDRRDTDDRPTGAD